MFQQPEPPCDSGGTRHPSKPATWTTVIARDTPLSSASPRLRVTYFLQSLPHQVRFVAGSLFHPFPIHFVLQTFHFCSLCKFPSSSLPLLPSVQKSVASLPVLRRDYPHPRLKLSLSSSLSVSSVTSCSNSLVSALPVCGYFFTSRTQTGPPFAHEQLFNSPPAILTRRQSLFLNLVAHPFSRSSPTSRSATCNLRLGT